MIDYEQYLYSKKVSSGDNFNRQAYILIICFGLLTGYPCCTANFHQGWPKFTRNLWHATSDGGLAALVYSPCEVTAKVAGGIEVKIIEETRYPFEEKIRFTVKLGEKKPVKFPLHFRIPAWCKNASAQIVNPAPAPNSFAIPPPIDSHFLYRPNRARKKFDSVVYFTLACPPRYIEEGKSFCFSPLRRLKWPRSQKLPRPHRPQPTI